MAKIYIIPEGASLRMQEIGFQEVSLDLAEIAVVLLDKRINLDDKNIQNQIKQALEKVPVLGLLLVNYSVGHHTKAKSLGIEYISSHVFGAYNITQAVKAFYGLHH